jgi:hypothetical protein
MSMVPGQWREIAVKLAEHASSVLPRARSAPSPWADAMRRELDYIKDDRAALHWAIGCVMASYRAQLMTLLRLCGRVLSRPILAGGMLLSVALALAHANDLAKAPVPALEQRTCALPGMPLHFIAKESLGE